MVSPVIVSQQSEAYLVQIFCYGFVSQTLESVFPYYGRWDG